MRFLAATAALVLAATLAGCAGSGGGTTGAAPAASTALVAAATTTAQAHAPKDDIYDWLPHLYDRVAPTTVAIFVRMPQGAAEGSGAIWSKDGYIVTDAHVVESAQQVQVALATGERVAAKVVGTDPPTDLAVLKISRSGLPTARFSDGLPEIGQLAVAIGSPLGFRSSMTAGIVSGLNRSLPTGAVSNLPLVDLIQTDAPISPGNSGGPLVDENGVVIGINEAYIPPQQGAVSIGFATPAPIVTDVVKQLIQNGKVEHAFLGIQPADITPALARQYGLATDTGVLVYDVVQGSPAAKAGLRRGDVIVELGSRKVANATDLFAALRNHRPGETVRVTVVRDGDRRRLQATLAGRAPSGG